MRLNRVAVELGLTTRRRSRKSQYAVTPKNANSTESKGQGMEENLTFHEMEDVVDANNQDEREHFVVGYPGGEVHAENSKEPPMQSNSAADASVAEGPVPKDTAEQNGGDRANDNVETNAAATEVVSTCEPNEAENASDVETQPATDDEPESCEGTISKPPIADSHESSDSEKDGYGCAMELLQLIYEHGDEPVLKERYGEKWSLSGIIGTAFDDAKKMLLEVKDYFAFHVGEIVSSITGNGTAAGVILFVDAEEGSIAVFDGVRILSYKQESLQKTGKTFRDVMQDGGFSLR